MGFFYSDLAALAALAAPTPPHTHTHPYYTLLTCGGGRGEERERRGGHSIQLTGSPAKLPDGTAVALNWLQF